MKKPKIIYYPIVIAPIEDYFMAYLPDFGWSTCSATADTMQEALDLLEKVFDNIIDYFIESGRPIPKPKENAHQVYSNHIISNLIKENERLKKIAVEHSWITNPERMGK